MAQALQTQTKRSLVTAGSAAAVALAISQIVEQTIGAWHPKTAVTVWIAVLVAFLGALLSAARNRLDAAAALKARRKQLNGLLGAWPAPLVRDADPARLGVFPPRRAISAEAPYVARLIDAPVREALLAGDAVVLICGERRAGASRTAFEAVRHALGGAVLIAPRSADCLRALTELEDPLSLGDRDVVVWLDGLDRYAEALDAESLAALRAVAHRVSVVATIRRDHWDEWLGATGAEGEAVRGLLGQARVFELSSGLDAGELETAQRLYSDADLSAGIGAAIASGGYEMATVHAPAGERGSEEEPDPTPVWWLDRRTIVPLLGTCAALVALAIYFGPAGWRTISISEQITAIEREGSQGERHVAVAKKVNLHADVDSRLFVFTDNLNAREPRSDEILIYDENSGSLKRALRFAPDGPPAVFSERAIADVDGDGSDEIVGGFGYSDGGGAMVPFAIDWNRTGERYVLITLGQRLPSFSHAARVVQEQQYLRLYESTTTLSDRADGLSISGHRVQDFDVTAEPYRLVAGWFTLPHIHKRAATFELHPAIFVRTTGAPHLTRCKFSGEPDPLIVPVGEGRAPYKVFDETYDRLPDRLSCDPLYGSEPD
jgi:hypothetical protein